MKLKGAEVLLECLKEQEVDVIFGYPGGAVLPIYDALYHEKKIRHILTAHEQGATHAADGYARSTGKVGVVIATSGPGATNTVTGIATAFRDSVPMVVFTGQVAQPLLGRASFQEIDITSITNTITKKNYLVTDVKSLPSIIREAFLEASTGRPGPVLVDIPKDIQTAELDYKPGIKSRPVTKEYTLDLCEAVKLINESAKPMIYAGGGVNISGASEELRMFAEKIKSPVACSLMGLGSFPGEHPLFTGMVGMHGTYTSNHSVANSDLLIAIGARFSDRVIGNAHSFAQNARIIHIDIDPNEFNKNISSNLTICGDVKDIIFKLYKLVSEKKESEWNSQVQVWKETHPLRYSDSSTVNPQFVMNTLYEMSKGNFIITTEVGQNQIWAAQFYRYAEPRTFISSGGLGTMGFGLGAAIGASLGRKDKKIINIAGDGSFKMNSQELSTVARYKVPIVQLIFNNHALGMVHQWQEMFYDGNYSHSELEQDVDFIKLGEAYGIKGFKITSNNQVRDILTAAISLKEPCIVECDIHTAEKVFPMVAPGASITELVECQC